jgi:spermidine/putrescine transport system substrate-binding protein
MNDDNNSERPAVDPALVRGLTEPRMGRRGFLSAAGLGAGLLGFSALLSACGVSGSKGGTASIDWTKFWKEHKKTGQLNFANWPLYIDSDHGKSKSLELFTKATGIKVNYTPVIQGVESFYAKIQPQLKAGQPTGYDLAVVTNGWNLTELIDANLLTPLDQSRMPNFRKNASDLVKNPPYDPANKYTVTWQTGFTGIAYNTKYITRPITSFADLRDPAFNGHVGMMNDNVELGCAALLAIGVHPETSTVADWKKAATWLKAQRPLVAGYYDQSYIQHLENGDTWITQAWSGDIFQANQSGYPHLKFVVPNEGQVVWHDNMLIPRYAQHPVDAMEWINFYYTPEIAGLVEDWVNYVCPVPGAQQYILKTLKDPTVANSPLVFPSAEINAKSHSYPVFKNYAQFQQWNNIFNPIIQS